MQVGLVNPNLTIFDSHDAQKHQDTYVDSIALLVTPRMEIWAFHFWSAGVVTFYLISGNIVCSNYRAYFKCMFSK